MLLERALTALNEGKAVRTLALTAEEQARLRDFNFLTAKPVLYVANVDEAGLKGGNEFVDRVEKLAAAEHAGCVVICAAIEAELSGLAPADRQEFMIDLGLEEPGLNRLIRAGYALLGLQTYFTTPDV